MDNIKIPKGIQTPENFKKLFSEETENMITGGVFTGLTMHGIQSLATNAPTIAFILKFNDKEKAHETVRNFVIKRMSRGIYYSTMLRLSILNDIDLNTIYSYWTQRSVTFSMRLMDAINKSNRETIEYFISDKKFQKGLKKMSSNDIKALDNLELSDIWQESKFFVSLVSEIYTETGNLGRHLPDTVKDIFLF